MLPPGEGGACPLAGWVGESARSTATSGVTTRYSLTTPTLFPTIPQPAWKPPPGAAPVAEGDLGGVGEARSNFKAAAPP